MGYLISGIVTAFILLVSFIWTQPDGKLHITFCDVGQGDGAYIQFPDGRDMVVDGGPNDAIVDCLGRHMPFWDRSIDIVLMTHPQKDHMQGLITVLDRYQVDYFVRSNVANDTDGYKRLMEVVERKQVTQKFVTQGETIDIGGTSLLVLWPSQAQLAKASPADVEDSSQAVLGAAVGDLNDYSVVFALRYGNFDAVFTGDADSRIESQYVGSPLADETVELLKVPHHGSKTGMTQEFIEWVKPRIAIISVGKNNYGHPTKEAITLLQSVGAQILRTDDIGDIAVISDGQQWVIED